MNINKLFPTSIGTEFCNDRESFKELFFSKIMNYVDDEGYTGESRGFVDLQTEETYQPIYRYISQSIDRYLDEHQVAYENFDINIVKSWANVIRDRDTPGHAHGDAHYSFVYYVNVPNEDKTKKLLTFEHPFRNNLLNTPNEGFLDMFANNIRDNQWNILNGYQWSFEVNEGELYVFPSHLFHFTQTNGDTVVNIAEKPYKTVEDIKAKRICIAGDVLLTYKDKQPKATGPQPIKNWRVF